MFYSEITESSINLFINIYIYLKIFKAYIYLFFNIYMLFCLSFVVCFNVLETNSGNIYFVTPFLIN